VKSPQGVWKHRGRKHTGSWGSNRPMKKLYVRSVIITVTNKSHVSIISFVALLVGWSNAGWCDARNKETEGTAQRRMEKTELCERSNEKGVKRGKLPLACSSHLAVGCNSRNETNFSSNFFILSSPCILYIAITFTNKCPSTRFYVTTHLIMLLWQNVPLRIMFKHRNMSGNLMWIII
jgi:hypothetical protein